MKQNQNKIEREMHVLLYSSYFQEDRDSVFQFSTKTEMLNLINGEKTKNLRELFPRSSLKSLNSLAKFLQSTLDKLKSTTDT